LQSADWVVPHNGSFGLLQLQLRVVWYNVLPPPVRVQVENPLQAPFGQDGSLAWHAAGEVLPVVEVVPPLGQAVHDGFGTLLLPPVE
jgi:hypothetical protein